MVCSVQKSRSIGRDCVGARWKHSDICTRALRVHFDEAATEVFLLRKNTVTRELFKHRLTNLHAKFACSPANALARSRTRKTNMLPCASICIKLLCTAVRVSTYLSASKMHVRCVQPLQEVCVPKQQKPALGSLKTRSPSSIEKNHVVLDSDPRMAGIWQQLPQESHQLHFTLPLSDCSSG